MRYSCLASRPCHWNCPGRLNCWSSFVVIHHHSRRARRASPSRRSGRAPPALPWRSSPARSRASPLVDATLRVSPPGGVSQLRGRPETCGGCRSARTGTSLSSTSPSICGSRRRCPLALLVQRKGVKGGTSNSSFLQTAAGVMSSAPAVRSSCACVAGWGGQPISSDARVTCPRETRCNRLNAISSWTGRI